MLNTPNINSFTLSGVIGSAATSISEGLTISVKKTEV